MGMFRDYLSEQGLFEMAVAKKGDYDFGNLNYINKGKLISTNGVNILFEEYHERTKEQLYIIETKSNSIKYVCVARKVVEEEKTKSGEVFRTIERFDPIVAMQLKYITKYRSLGYGSFRIVEGVETKDGIRNLGYGKFLYKKLVDNLKYVLMGDAEQYDKARMLWVSLSNHPDFNVDIVDLSNAKIIHKNVNLKDALDERIWTDEDLMLTGSNEERKIGRFNRLILTSVN